MYLLFTLLYDIGHIPSYSLGYIIDFLSFVVHTFTGIIGFNMSSSLQYFIGFRGIFIHLLLVIDFITCIHSSCVIDFYPHISFGFFIDLLVDSLKQPHEPKLRTHELLNSFLNNFREFYPTKTI